jgi:hypothetical protein
MFEDLNWLPQRGTLAGMSRLVTLVAGAVLTLLGLVWILQGLNIIGSSGMSGHGIWAVIGIVVGALGVFLVVRTLRTPPLRDDL